MQARPREQPLSSNLPQIKIADGRIRPENAWMLSAPALLQQDHTRMNLMELEAAQTVSAGLPGKVSECPHKTIRPDICVIARRLTIPPVASCEDRG